MTIQELKTTSTVKLIDLWEKALDNKNQSYVNVFARELAERIYVPNEEKTFEDLLAEFGYVDTHINANKKTIDF